MHFDIGEPLTCSGAHWRLCYDPEADRAYTWTGVGPGAPEYIYNGTHPTVVLLPDGAVPEAVEAWARKHEADIAQFLSDDTSDLDDALEESAEEIPCYWDAEDWISGDPYGCLDEVIELGLDGAVERNVERGRMDANAYLRVDDLRSALEELAERSLSDMDVNDPRCVPLFTRLYGTPGAAARRVMAEGDWPDDYTPDPDDRECVEALLDASGGSDYLVDAACRVLLDKWPHDQEEAEARWRALSALRDYVTGGSR